MIAWLLAFLLLSFEAWAVEPIDISALLSSVFPKPEISNAQLRSRSAAETAQSFADVRAYLHAQPVIRIYITKAPRSGHQAAGVKAMQRLRELGFTGTFEVVYDEEAAAKLKVLIPGFENARGGKQTIESPSLGKLALVSVPHSKELVGSEKASLALSAAFDKGEGRFLLSTLNAKSLVFLQPRGWYPGILPRKIYFDDRSETIDLSHLYDMSIPTERSNPAQLLNSINHDLSNQPSLVEKREGLGELVQMTEKADFLPVYAADFQGSPVHRLELLVKAIQRAKEIAPENFSQPVIIPVFSDLEQADRRAISDSMHALSAQCSEVSDPHSFAGDSLTGLPRSVRVVFVGPVSPDIFDGFFSRATLPVLLEGKNLSNHMRNLGQPFINVMGSTADLTGYEATSEPLRSRILTAYQSFASPEKANPDAVAHFFVEAKQPDSPLKKFFSAQTSGGGEDDQIFQSLSLLIEHEKNSAATCIRRKIVAQ
jgi:hypothetical protein